MSFKIGFTAETENKRTIENTPVQKEAPIVKKSVIEVFFPDRQRAYSYPPTEKSVVIFVSIAFLIEK